jgi:hypothetical protein
LYRTVRSKSPAAIASAADVSLRRRKAISCAKRSPTRTPISPAITPAFNAWSFRIPIAAATSGRRLTATTAKPAGVRSGAPTTTMPPLDVMNARLCPELAAVSASACSAGAGANRVRAGAFASKCPSLL